MGLACFLLNLCSLGSPLDLTYDGLESGELGPANACMLGWHVWVQKCLLCSPDPPFDLTHDGLASGELGPANSCLLVRHEGSGGWGWVLDLSCSNILFDRQPFGSYRH